MIYFIKRELNLVYFIGWTIFIPFNKMVRFNTKNYLRNYFQKIVRSIFISAIAPGQIRLQRILRIFYYNISKKQLYISANIRNIYIRLIFLSLPATSLCLFHDGVFYYIETYPLICFAKQWSGFYMKGPPSWKIWWWYIFR